MGLEGTILGDLWVFLAGAVGSLVPAALLPKMSQRSRLVYVGIGMATATFIAPGINSHLLPEGGAQLQGSVSFVVGLIGMKLAEIIIRVFDQRGAKVIERLAGAFLGSQRVEDDLQPKQVAKRSSVVGRKSKSKALPAQDQPVYEEGDGNPEMSVSKE